MLNFPMVPILYITYSTVGRSIASISDLSGIFLYLSTSHLGKYVASGLMIYRL